MQQQQMANGKTMCTYAKTSIFEFYETNLNLKYKHFVESIYTIFELEPLEPNQHKSKEKEIQENLLSNRKYG